MTCGPMRKLPAPSAPLSRLQCSHSRSLSSQPLNKCSPSYLTHQTRRLAQVRLEPLSELWFTSSAPRRSPADETSGSSSPPAGSDNQLPNERRLGLGKTLRTLSALLPTILTSPLPNEILSPSISLHLFPSTHPHLPVCRGRISYRAALWTAPVAWGCVPIVGNVKLQIISEKVVRSSFYTPIEGNDVGEEKLVVRWRTIKKKNGQATESVGRSSTVENGGINRGLSTLLGGDKPIFNLNKSDEFTGLFVFTFDAKGRIATHTIEHADEDKGYDQTSRMVTLTDWLLGKARGATREKEGTLVPGLAMRELSRDQREGRGRLW